MDAWDVIAPVLVVAAAIVVAALLYFGVTAVHDAFVRRRKERETAEARAHQRAPRKRGR